MDRRQIDGEQLSVFSVYFHQFGKAQVVRLDFKYNDVAIRLIYDFSESKRINEVNVRL